VISGGIGDNGIDNVNQPLKAGLIHKSVIDSAPKVISGHWDSLVKTDGFIKLDTGYLLLLNPSVDYSTKSVKKM